MNDKSNDFSGGTTGALAGERKREWTSFLLLACVGLPLAMGGLIAVYGFVVWFLQIWVFGPPS